MEPEVDPASVRLQRFLADHRPAVAAWVPGWYELDPPLEVGLTADFMFWRVVPEALRGPESLVFYNTLWTPGAGVVARGTISALRHPELGDVCIVDTRGLDYKITLMDGTDLLINAEEEPGFTYIRVGDQWVARTPQVRDWRFVVKFSALGELAAP